MKEVIKMGTTSSCHVRNEVSGCCPGQLSVARAPCVFRPRVARSPRVSREAGKMDLRVEIGPFKTLVIN